MQIIRIYFVGNVGHPVLMKISVNDENQAQSDETLQVMLPVSH